MSWMGTQPRCLAPDAGSSFETKKSALGACLSVDTYSNNRLHQLSSSQSACRERMLYSKKTKYQDTLGALGTSLRRHIRGSQRGRARLGPTPSAAHLAPLFAAPNHNSSWLLLARISGRAVSPDFEYIRFLRTRRPTRFPNYAAENPIGSESEA